MGDKPIGTRAPTTPLVIPDAAQVALSLGNAEHAIRVTVAVELRRLAVAIGPQAGVVDGSDAMTRRACAAELTARADELDGGA